MVNRSAKAICWFGTQDKLSSGLHSEVTEGEIEKI